MHSHVLNFKADFDILGQSNSVQLMSVVPTSKTYPCKFFSLFYLALWLLSRTLAVAEQILACAVPNTCAYSQGPWARRETP